MAQSSPIEELYGALDAAKPLVHGVVGGSGTVLVASAYKGWQERGWSSEDH